MMGKKVKVRSAVRILMAVVVLLAVICAVFPLIYMLLVSLTQKITLDLYFNPATFNLDNYRRIFGNLNIIRNMTNSIIVTICACFFNCLFSSMAAYGFAKHRFKGREALFMLFLATMMIPGQATLIPVFTIMRQFHLLNTYFALVLPLINAFGVFLIRQFMNGVPDELIEAARIDGCGEHRIYAKIVLPLIKPVLISLTIFTFITAWNDFLWPLVVITRSEMQTVTLAMSTLKGNLTVNYGLVMAGTTLAFIPPFIMYVFLQKEFVEGIAMSGIKA